MNRLKDIRKYDILIKHKLEELERLNELMKSAKVSDYTKERIQTSPIDDPLNEVCFKIMNLEKELSKDIEALCDLKKECLDKLDEIEDPILIDIAYKRYFEFKTFDKIADEMNMSTRWILELHKTLFS